MATSMGRGRRKNHGMTPRDQLVLDYLRVQRSAVTAYQLIDALAAHGLSAPPTVYRVLARLTQKGLVHRLHALNSFIACTHERHDGVPVFVICEACRTVSERDVAAISQQLRDAASALNFESSHATIEILGRCKDCDPA